MEDKEILIMATSSIFANIKITEPEKVEAFVDALEVSIADPMPASNIQIMSILDVLEYDGEKKLNDRLSAFSCPANMEIDSFLKVNALNFAKRKLSIITTNKLHTIF